MTERISLDEFQGQFEGFKREMQVEGFLATMRERLGGVYLKWLFNTELPSVQDPAKIIIESRLLLLLIPPDSVSVVNSSEFPFAAFPSVLQVAGKFTFFQNPIIPEDPKAEKAYFQVAMKLWSGLEILRKVLALPLSLGQFDQMHGSTSLDQAMLAYSDLPRFREFTDQFGTLGANQDPAANDWKVMKDILQKNAEVLALPKTKK